MVRPAPSRWSDGEIEKLCRRLNAIDTLVIGVVESRFRCAVWTKVARARRAWVEGGRQWRYPKERPADWDPETALAALPSKWRDL